MSHFIIPEENEQLWKNSEVMRNFVQEMEKQSQQNFSSEPTYTEASNLDTREGVSQEIEDLPEEFNLASLAKEAAKSDVLTVIEKLDAIAKESMKYGNEKATYMIEEAVYRLEDILHRVDEGE